MSEVASFPKFRKTTRFIKWLAKNDLAQPQKSWETIFFKSKEKPETIVQSLAEYSEFLTDYKLPQDLENLMIKLTNESDKTECVGWSDTGKHFQALSAVLKYCRNLHYRDIEPNPELINLFKGWSYYLIEWATTISQRLPKELEDSFDNPKALLKYSTEVLKGRLPLHLEDVFFKDVHVATEYAFQVIRGFAPVRLPDDLHNFVMMKSFESPNDERIKIYMRAAESDPNKMGNSVDEV